MNAAVNERNESLAEREIVIERLLDAPRELVFAAWTDPQHIAQWWGPNGFTSTIHEMDVRPGGRFRLTMHGPDGTDWPNVILYEEVVKPERLVYAHGDDEKPDQFHVTITFAEEGKKTRLTMRTVFPTKEARDYVVREVGAIEGGNQTVSRLAAYLPALDEDALVITRTFDAPRELVFKAWTDREHLMKWWGPKGFEVAHCTNDLRPGGTMHYGLRGPGGAMMWGKWVYREVAPPHRLSFVASFSDEQGGVTRAPFFDVWPLETLSTITFTEQDGKTTVTMRGIPINENDAERAKFKDMHPSMQQGWSGTLDQLAAHLANEVGS
jgi:uncharacterized protein YndB with AHSA1/START domain